MTDSAMRRSALTNVDMLLVTAASAVLIAVLLPPQQSHREAAPRAICKENLKQIGIALWNYQDHYKCFPPAYVADASGRQMHSWRVLLLPYLDAQNVYDQYRFDEPWDGPHNSKLVDQMPKTFCCPNFNAKRPFQTTYVAMSGPGTGFDGSQSKSVGDIKDSTATTVLIVETKAHAVHWMEPDDISVDELLVEVAQSDSQAHANHRGGTHFLFADASVRFIHHNCNRTTLRAVCTIAGGEPASKF